VKAPEPALEVSVELREAAEELATVPRWLVNVPLARWKS